MRNLILALLVIAGGILVYKYFVEPENGRATAAAAADPARRFQEIVDQGQASAAEIGMLCERYPQLAQRYLPNSLVRLDGNIRNVHLTGVGHNVLEMQLDTAGKKPVCLRLDLQKYNNLTVNNEEAKRARYEIVGYEVLMILRPKPNQRVDSEDSESSGKVIYRVGQKVSERGRFTGLGVAEVHFNAE
jgi:hypothetical protein